MALFELENGRLIPAQFGRDVPEGFTDDVLEAIRSQVLEIVSRPLFPIAWSTEGHSKGTECSRLTGLDASGQVVAVEVMRRLDSEGLIDSLSRLSDTAALSWGDLARQHPMGPDGFRREWVMFREAMPPSPPNGPRLILVTTEIADEIRPALDVLSSSGIEVHHMTLRQMTNGRAFLDVEAVGPRIYGHRANTLLETSSVLPVIGSAGNLEAAARKKPESDSQSTDKGASDEPLRTVDEESQVQPEDPTVEITLPKEELAGLLVPTLDEPTVEIEAPVDYASIEQAESAATDEQPVADDSVDVAELDEQATGLEPDTVTGPAPLALPPELAIEDLPGEPVDEPTFQVPLPSRRSLRYSEPDEAEGTELPRRRSNRVPPPPPLPTRRSISTTLGHRAPSHTEKVPSHTAGVPLPTRSERHRGETGAIPIVEGLSDLGLIAASAGGDVPLFLKSGEDTPSGAVLTVTGQIRVPSGEYTDPLSALVAEGAPAIDGWRDWHLASPEGPTLADALQELGAR